MSNLVVEISSLIKNNSLRLYMLHIDVISVSSVSNSSSFKNLIEQMEHKLCQILYLGQVLCIVSVF